MHAATRFRSHSMPMPILTWFTGFVGTTSSRQRTSARRGTLINRDSGIPSKSRYAIAWRCRAQPRRRGVVHAHQLRGALAVVRGKLERSKGFDAPVPGTNCDELSVRRHERGAVALARRKLEPAAQKIGIAGTRLDARID